jgi:hypothetical protein
LVRAVVVRRPLLASAVASFSLLTSWAGSRWEAQAAASPAEEARQLLTAVEADAATRELVSRAVAQAHSALDRAQASAEAGTERELLEATALEWAQSARDLQRARAAEQASDGLEQSLSTLQTELVRTRASVEQALARVGRARQELTDLERNAPGSGAIKAPSSKAATSADGTAVRQAPAAKPADGTPGGQAPATKTPAPTKQAPASQAAPATPPPGARP